MLNLTNLVRHRSAANSSRSVEIEAMDVAELQARVLARLSKAHEKSDIEAQDAYESSSSDSSSDAERIDVAPVARARKDRKTVEQAQVIEAEREAKKSCLSGLCSRRALARWIRSQRKKLKILLAATTLSLLLFLMSTVLFLEAPKRDIPDIPYHSGEIPREAWLAAGWGLPPVIKEERTSTSSPRAG